MQLYEGIYYEDGHFRDNAEEGAEPEGVDAGLCVDKEQGKYDGAEDEEYECLHFKI